MSIARALARVLRNNFQMHVAWVPVTTSFSLGDYGLWRGGVFVPLGNIREFGVEARSERGREITLEFMSSRRASTQVDAEVEVPQLPSSGAETHLHFEAGQSFLIKVGKLVSTRISNVAEVARKLDATGRWRWQYKVVSELFVGEDVLLVATSERDTTVSLRGTGRATVAGHEGVKLDAGVSVTADRQLGLNISGGTGPVGLGLFRVRLSGNLALNFAEAVGDDSFVGRDGALLEIGAEDRWDAAPADDEPDAR